MSIRTYLDSALSSCVSLYGQAHEVASFRLFAESFDNLTARTSLAGHLTGSALVWHRSTDSVLRVFHAKLNCWVLSAGGHIDGGEMPWQASSRELHEETGIIARPLFDPQTPLPLSLGVHAIPASVKKREPAHWHYDMVYLFEVETLPVIKADPGEILQHEWVAVDQVTQENAALDLRYHISRYPL